MKQKFAFGLQVFSILFVILSVFITYLVRDESLRISAQYNVQEEEMSGSSVQLTPFTFVIQEVIEGN